jgi:hypothetical protein
VAVSLRAEDHGPVLTGCHHRHRSRTTVPGKAVAVIRRLKSYVAVAAISLSLPTGNARSTAAVNSWFIREMVKAARQPFRHIALAAVYLDQPLDVIAALGAQLVAFDVELPLMSPKIGSHPAVRLRSREGPDAA